jgi:hypothetical protein
MSPPYSEQHMPHITRPLSCSHDCDWRVHVMEHFIQGLKRELGEDGAKLYFGRSL